MWPWRRRRTKKADVEPVDDERAHVEKLIETGGEIAGSAAGAAIGLLIAGPLGALGGATAGPLLTRAFRTVGSEVRRRVMAPREEMRVGAAVAFAASAIADALAAGSEVRRDGFFEPRDDDRPAAEEILEGVLLKARDSYEEKKIRHLSHLFAAIATDESITPADANSLIELTHRLTYRQLVCLSAFYDPDVAALPSWTRGGPIPRGLLSLAGELLDLGQRGLLERLDRKRIDGLGDVDPQNIRTVRTGRFLYRVLRLDLISAEDQRALFADA